MTRARITDQWLPLPEAILTALGWSEGDQIELAATAGGVLTASRVAATPVARPAPSKGKRMPGGGS